MPSGRMTIESKNYAAGLGNSALVTAHFASPGVTVEEAAAQLFLYARTYWPVGVGTWVEGIEFRANGSAGSIAVPFPLDEVNAIRAAVPGFPTDVAYGQTFGAGDLTPSGTAILVQELTASPGRRSTGRHYVPFISASVVNAGGGLDSTEAGLLPQRYMNMMRNPSGTFPAVVKDLSPIVRSKFPVPGGTDYLIQGAVCSSNFATLRSRKR